MLYIIYLITVTAVVWFSILASRYIDMIDRSTRLSGAFLGGVLLSAITSLPELFTSISATVLIDNPSLCIGNILGSNLFNFGMLAVVIIIFIKGFTAAKLARSHRYVMLLLMGMYLATMLNWKVMGDCNIVFGSADRPWFFLSATSVIVLVLYALSVRFLASDNGSEDEEPQGEEVKLSLRAIVVRFVLASLGIIVASVILTYVTDDIATSLNLGSGLAGALFLSVVAVLPVIAGPHIIRHVIEWIYSGNASYASNVSYFEGLAQQLSGVFTFGGTSLIIVIGVALETFRELEAQLTMRNYKGFL